MTWYFERYAQMGGASAGAFRNTLAGVGVPPTDVFVREVLQNSVDAATNEAPVRVVFRERTIDQEALTRFREVLDLGERSPVLERQGLLADTTTEDLLVGPVPALYVEDFNTKGLGGTDEPRAQSPEDNYRRLCLELGVTGEGQIRGGTFGYGKAAYWAVSELWTVFFYSRFEPTERTDGAFSRLVGVSWFNEHVHRSGDDQDLRFTGRAWFGRVPESEDYCLPFVNEAADELASKLGFTPRSAQDTGTSAMILRHGIDATDVVEAVERNWWPRILEGRLDVVLPDGSSPSPRTNARLRPFIRAWDLVSGNLAADENDAIKDLAYRGHPLGKAALTTSDEGPDEGRNAQIALVRGPGMIVTEYQGPTSAVSQPFTVGVFKADPEMESAFAASEPPAHDRWDPTTNRTDRHLTEADRKRIQQTIKKIRGTVNEFLRVHQESPPEAPPRCQQLEKVLGEFFATRETGPPPPPPRDNDIFSVQFSEFTREIDDTRGEVRLAASMSVRATDDAFAEGEDSIVVWVTAWADPLLDDGRKASKSDRLKMTYMRADDPKDQDAVMGENRPGGTVAELLMAPDEGAWSIELLSEPLPHPEYSARFGFLIERKDI